MNANVMKKLRVKLIANIIKKLGLNSIYIKCIWISCKNEKKLFHFFFIIFYFFWKSWNGREFTKLVLETESRNSRDQEFWNHEMRRSLVLVSVLHSVLQGGHVNIGLQTEVVRWIIIIIIGQRAWIPDQTNNQFYMLTWL